MCQYAYTLLSLFLLLLLLCRTPEEEEEGEEGERDLFIQERNRFFLHSSLCSVDQVFHPRCVVVVVSTVVEVYLLVVVLVRNRLMNIIVDGRNRQYKGNDR